MRNIIVAYDKKGGIGAANDLLWLRDLPADLHHFKELTTGSTVIMGRKTYASIGRPLVNRDNIVISYSPDSIEGVTVVENIQQAYNMAKTEEIFVIGGGQIYRLALDSVDRIYATEVDGVFPLADIFFPILGDEWVEISRQHRAKDKDNKYNMDFVVYERTTR